MKRKKWMIGFVSAALISLSAGFASQAAFEPEMEAAYNTAVQGQDALDGLDVTVRETVISGSTNQSATKRVALKVSGIKGASLKADIAVRTDEGTSESYYQNGYYYTTTANGQEKREMERADIWEKINAEIYLDMTSNYLRMLYSEKGSDGTVTYHFAATPETLGDYSKKLLEGSGGDQGAKVDSLHGTMEVNRDGHVVKREIDMVYTVANGENQESFFARTVARFRQNGQTVSVDLPDLSAYQTSQPEKPEATITPLLRTVYATDDVNVRAAGDLTSVILGGLSAGSGITETGYTSDGWIQVQYNGAIGYIWGDYISASMPVLTKNGSGTMYATASVNVRQSYSSDSAILGGLSRGQGIEITGTTNNGWVRVKYNGQTGYVYADYLSWSEPVTETYVKNGYMTGIVTEASYGSLTIARDDGQGSAMFNTSYAALNLRDTIYTGDWVEVYYTGAGAPYTATQVNDYIRHSDSPQERSCSIEGVVASCTPNRLELSCSDGTYRTFDITDADIEMADNLSAGQYVEVTWMSSTNGSETRNIEALRVRG